MTLVEMSIVERESGVRELAARLVETLKERGEIPGTRVVETLADATGSTRAEVRLALGRVPLRFLANGNVAY